MLRAKYQCELNKLKVEENYMITIANHIEDQINRLKVEEMALNSQLTIQENESSIKKEPLPEKSDDDINAVPLNLGVNYMNNDDDDDDDDDEEEDEDVENTAEGTQLSNFLDQLAQQHQEGVEDEDGS